MSPSTYRSYLLTMLLVILAFNLMDRVALGLLAQTIKVDLNLDDTELGFLSGLAFAAFYAVMGIPIARWTDRGNRVVIIGITTGLWSVMVALCGAAASFTQLLVTRVGVAIGEAGCIPPAHSLIADYFDRAQRPKAVSVYMLGGPLSMVLGYFLAGWLNEFFGWRMTFMLLGVPGLGLAVLAWFTLREPRLEKSGRPVEPGLVITDPCPREQAGTSDKQLSLVEACVSLSANRTYRHLLLCFAVASFFGYGCAQWQPAFFIRSYGLQTGELGTLFAVIWGGGGMLGVYLGGALASRYAVHNERLQLKAMAIVYVGFALISALIYTSPNHYMAFGFMGIAAIGGATLSGPLFALVQTLVPWHMRAISISVIYLFANLIGMGLGPLVAGALSDALRVWVGEESLRYSLLSLCPGYFWCGWHLWQASRTVEGDLSSLHGRVESAVEGQIGAFNCDDSLVSQEQSR